MTTPIEEWTILLGSTGNEEAKSISSTPDGSVYIVGRTNGDLDGQINTGDYDAFISKYDSSGAKQWTRLLGTNAEEHGTSICTVNDGSIYIAGYTNGTKLDGQKKTGVTYDAFIAKFDSNGVKQWTQLLGQPNSKAFSISADSDGSLYIAGSAGGKINGEWTSGGGDAFLAKYSSLGEKIWVQRIGTENYDEASSVTTANDGSIYVAGYTGVDLGDSWDDYDHPFIGKYNRDGSLQWIHSLDESSSNYRINSITTFDNEYVYFAGKGNYVGVPDWNANNGGGIDAWIGKYLADGTRIWTDLLGTVAEDQAYSISAAPDGSIYITGHTWGSNFDGQESDSPQDAFITKFNDHYYNLKELTLGFGEELGIQYSNSISATTGGSIYTTGTTYSELDDQAHIGQGDAFIKKYRINNAPNYIDISSTSFSEDIASGTIVATISTSDIDIGDTFLYSLKDGGDSFAIEGDQLKIINPPDFETKSSYSIRLQTQDSGGLAFERTFILSVDDINEIATGLSISESTILTDIAAGSIIANLRTVDPDNGDSHSYALVPGVGDTDNSTFTIDGDKLRINELPNITTKPTYSIRLQTSDSGGLTLENSFILTVNEPPQMPTVQSLSDIKNQKNVSTFKFQNQILLSGLDIDTVIVGTKKKDKITGTSGGEVLAGMKGKDVLKGGKGADGFLFNQSGSFGNKHVDQIKDFDSDEGDSILVDQESFGLGKKIKLKSYGSKNKVKKAAKSKNDFVYDEKKGLLYFNENGKQKGWGDGGLFAKLQGAPELGADDFTIV